MQHRRLAGSARLDADESDIQLLRIPELKHNAAETHLSRTLDARYALDLRQLLAIKLTLGYREIDVGLEDNQVAVQFLDVLFVALTEAVGERVGEQHQRGDQRNHETEQQEASPIAGHFNDGKVDWHRSTFGSAV